MDFGWLAAMAQLGPIPWLLGVAVVVLIGFFRALQTGKLVPRSTLDILLAQDRAQISAITEDRDKWRSAHQQSEETRTIMRDQLREISGGVQLGARAIDELKTVVKGRDA